MISPVDESVVQQENGVVGRALHRGHGAVHEDVQSVVHGALALHGHASVWISETCRIGAQKGMTVTFLSCYSLE